MARNPYIKISDIRGGINDADSPFSLADNEVVEAENIDFRAGMLGSKRGGLSAISLTGSVFEHDVPVMAVRNTGTMVGAASTTVAISANGASASTHMLIVSVSRTAGANITSMDLGGVALAQATIVTNGADLRVDQWFLAAPSISGGTLTVNFSGVCNAAIVAERWTNVDTAASPHSGQGANGTSGIIDVNNTGLDPRSMFVSATAWGAATLTLDGVGTVTNHQIISGGGTPARLQTDAIIGRKPVTKSVQGMSASVAWVWASMGLRGTTGGSVPRTFVSVMRHQPTNSIFNDEIWIQDEFGRIDRRVAGTWQTGVPMPNYRVGSFSVGSYNTNGTSLHGKFFLALMGTVYNDVYGGDRLHVWDGTVLRFAGMYVTPTAPTAADSGGAGAMSGRRYYRFRYVEIAGGVVVRRSEPSPVLSFLPGGANASITITLPARVTYYDEGETHWELESSVDNVLFYRTHSTVIGTTSVTDSTSYSVGYSANPLSEALTEYIPLKSARHVAVDEDRLITGGNVLGAANLDSRVNWTPLSGDLGAGNDERQPATARFFLDLDGLSGGHLTHLTPATMGGMLCFKNERLYKLIRSGNPNRAYNSIQLTPNRGARMRSACSGTDEHGKPCVYFWDPNVGLCRWGEHGCKDLMQKRRTLAASVSNHLSVVIRSIFHPIHWLVWVAIPVGTGAFPTEIACFNVRQGSWTRYTGVMTKVASWVLFPDAVNALTPIITLTEFTGNSKKFGRADTSVNDDGTRYRAFFKTKAYTIGELFSEFEIGGAMLHAKASAATIAVSAIRNVGLESKATDNQSIAAVGGQTYSNAQFDDLRMAELEQVQFEVGDPSGFAGSQLDQVFTLESLVVKYLGGGELKG